MPNIHVRDVPPETVDTLKAAAKRRGRSLNAEIIEALVRQAEREDFVDRLKEGRRRWKRWFPEGFPPGLEPETIIRRHRDGG